MKSKRTHRLRSMGDAGVIVAASENVADAAKRLGVERSTIHRWVRDGKVPAPGSAGPAAAGGEAVADPPAELVAPVGQAAVWAARVRRECVLDATGLRLLDLAVDALGVAKDVTVRADIRLSAMSRYQALVRQLRLEGHGKREPAVEPSRAVLPTRRVTHDPRRILQAVK